MHFGPDDNVAHYTVINKNVLGTNLSDHFPDSLQSSNLMIHKHFEPKKNQIEYFIINYNLDTLFINELTEKYSKKSKAKNNAGDSCAFVIKKQPCQINKNDSLYFPIPDFSSLRLKNVSTKTSLPNDFDIYILDAKSGIFWEEDELRPLISMPKNWENGFSKGIAVSKKRRAIIYWSIIW